MNTNHNINNISISLENVSGLDPSLSLDNLADVEKDATETSDPIAFERRAMTKSPALLATPDSTNLENLFSFLTLQFHSKISKTEKDSKQDDGNNNENSNDSGVCYPSLPSKSVLRLLDQELAHIQKEVSRIKPLNQQPTSSNRPTSSSTLRIKNELDYRTWQLKQSNNLVSVLQAQLRKRNHRVVQLETELDKTTKDRQLHANNHDTETIHHNQQHREQLLSLRLKLAETEELLHHVQRNQQRSRRVSSSRSPPPLPDQQPNTIDQFKISHLNQPTLMQHHQEDCQQVGMLLDKITLLQTERDSMANIIEECCRCLRETKSQSIPRSSNNLSLPIPIPETQNELPQCIRSTLELCSKLTILIQDLISAQTQT